MLGTNEMVKDRIRAYKRGGITIIRVDPEGEGFGGWLETLGRFMELIDAVDREG